MNKYKKLSVSAILSIAILGTTVFAATGKVYNTSQGLVLRGSASKSGAPLATVANGAEVEILENNGEWYKVNANGKEGYLFAEYVQVQEETVNNTNNNEDTNNSSNNEEKKIYVLPIITSTTIGIVPAEAEINIIKTVGNWEYITYQNINGWIRNAKVNSETVEETEAEHEDNEETQEEEHTTKETQETTEIVEETTKPSETTDVSFRKGYISVDAANVRKEPSTSSDIVTTLILNTGVTISAQTDEWYRITYGDYMGYVYKPLISENPTPTSRSQEARTTVEENTTEGDSVVEATTSQDTETSVSTSGSSAGQNIVDFAKQYLGYSYVYGGTTPGGGFDCSGFVYYVFNSCGYSLSRSCTVQAQSGTAVSRSELQPGDILFFNNTSNGAIGHTGIYIGEGRFIHAANPRRGVVTDTINSGYYNTYYYSARRVAN